MKRMIVALAAMLVATPGLSGPLEQQLFGQDMGEEALHSCFVRHYDEPHLRVHPQQNVTDMALLVSAQPGEGYEGFYGVSIGVRFRGVTNELQLAGGCGAGDDGKTLGCGIDCDGGVIDVALRDENSVRVEIPYGARTWDPESDGEPDPAAEFGEDDKVFRLDRADLKECLNLVWDEDLKARIAAGE
jgi:hypothetical protein